jgi:DNA-binding transcriptional ArsR family regulator
MLVESVEGTQRVYDSLLLKPEHLGIFSNELAVKIINGLAKQPLCAMDIAKKLKENEQKIYYHLRKMRDAGIVRLNGTEQRYGMTAKMFEVVSPVIATKLYDGGYESGSVSDVRDPEIEKFLRPFIINGKLNARIIIGAPVQHGQYEATARDGVHAVELGLFLGRFLSSGLSPYSYRMDTEIDKHRDIKNNLILIGNPKINTIVDMINSNLPIYFDHEKEWAITSTLTQNTYKYDDDALILKIKNPFDKKKEILLLAGKRSRGLRSAIIALTQHTHEVIKGNIEDEKTIAKVVRGIDKEGNGIIDSVTFME